MRRSSPSCDCCASRTAPRPAGCSSIRRRSRRRSGSVRLRRAADQWEAGAGEQAASAVAGAVLDRIRTLPAADWRATADALLDSLVVGAELAPGDCVLGVNLFSRSDPASGSWPWL